MKLKKSIKRGLVVLMFYSITTLCLLMTAERVERLERTNFRNENSSFSIQFSK